MKHFTLFFISSIILLGVGSCKKIANDGIPAYIRVDSMFLTTNGTTQGANTMNAPMIWVEVANEERGVWQLPSEIPILRSGVNNVRIIPGINSLSQNGGYVQYPFYKPYTVDLDLQPTKTINLKPEISYYPNTIFALNEAFESSNNFSEIRVNSAAAKNGFYGGVLEVNSTDSIKKATTNSSYTLPAGVPCYLETDFKSDGTFTIGLDYTLGGIDYNNILYVGNASASWKKIYVNLGEVIYETRASSYKLFFAMQKTDGSTTNTLQLDNIKIVHQ